MRAITTAQLVLAAILGLCLDMPYMLKAMVNYREASPTAISTCGNCVMFRKPDGCSLVIGEIRPQDVCDEWESKSG